MRQPLLAGIVLLALAALIAIPARGQAAEIDYTLTGLGNGRFEYSYTPVGYSFGTAGAPYIAQFDIDFPLGTDSALSLVSASPTGFGVGVVQPISTGNMGFLSDGDLEVVAFDPFDTPTSPFVVDFTYSGTGLPGSQSYTLEYGSDGDFVPAGGGQTTFVSYTPYSPPPSPPSPPNPITPVPEPGSLLLMAGSLVALGLRARLQRRSIPGR